MCDLRSLANMLHQHYPCQIEFPVFHSGIFAFYVRGTFLVPHNCSDFKQRQFTILAVFVGVGLLFLLKRGLKIK